MGASDFIEKAYKRLFDGAPDAMKAYMVAGLPLDFTSKVTPKGLTITATTRYPCRLVGDKLYYRKPA